MSVLYKALQKAAKENEEQAAGQAVEPEEEATSPFDPERLAGSGAISSSGSRLGGLKANWRVAGLASAVVLALVIVAVFFLVDSDDPAPVQVAQTPSAAPAPPPSAPPATEAPAPQTPMDVARNAAESGATEVPPAAPVPQAVEAAPEPAMAVDESTIAEAAAPAPVSTEPVSEPAAATSPAPAPAEPAPATAPEPAAPVAAPTQVASVPQPAPSPSAPANNEPMPRLGPNSEARVLSPPIVIRRTEAEFNAAEELVTVREVSQTAQQNVTAGYNALVRGDLGSALSRYEAAIEEEPTSVMAQLGRSAALQKLGRMEEVRMGYETVLRLDPNNRQARANLTSIFSASAPNEALSRLLQLEREYPDFSPITAQIGLLYARMGSTDDALTYLRKAASDSPETVMYQYNLAVLLDRVGRSEQAVVAYERVLAG